MGKSKKARAGDAQMLRAFLHRRKILKYVVIAAAVLVVLGLAVVSIWAPDSFWIVWVLLALYVVSFVALRYASHCPYCDKPIMNKFEKQTHCPYCRRAIRPGR